MGRHLKPIQLLITCVAIAIITIVASTFIYFKIICNSTDYSDSQIFSLVICIICTIVLTVLFFTLVFSYSQYAKRQQANNEQLRLDKARFEAIVEYSRWLIWEYNYSTNMINCTTLPQFKERTLEEFQDYLFDNKMTYPLDHDTIISFFKDFKSGRKDIFAEFRVKFKTKDFQWYELTATTLYDNSGNPLTVIAKTVNIDAQKNELERLRLSTEHDPLTNLYNFDAISHKAGQIINNSFIEPSLKHAAIIIDMDDFNIVTERYGLSMANAFLIDFSNRLVRCISDNDFAAYIGNNKFIVFLQNIKSSEHVASMVENIRSILDEIFLNDKNLHLTCSAGASIYPNDASNTEELFENADIALYIAKKHGKNRANMYVNTLRSTINMSEYLPRSIKNRTIKPLHELHSVVDSDLIFNIVDILFEAKDLDIAINMSLMIVGNYYGIDQLGIYELSENGSYSTMTYSWNSTSFESFSDRLKVIESVDSELFALYKSSHTGTYTSETADRLDLRDSSFKELLDETGLKSIYQCGILEKGEYKGYFFAHSLSQRDDWSSNVSDSLTLIAKIIGGYINKQRSEKNMDRKLQSDYLTGANNLMSFSTKVSQIMIEQPDKKYVMIYLDIDKFKYVNETFGYETGDFILIEFSKRLAALLNDYETFGRIVDDKFVIFVQYLNLEVLKKRMVDFRNAISNIKRSDEDCYNITVTAGINLVSCYENVSVLIDRANIARKSIKDRHRSSYAFFNDTMKNRLLKQKDFENVMDFALSNDEFCVYLQPKYNINTETLCGAEALVRWNRPDYGIIPPSEFIPIFEQNSFIIEIDYYIFENVCQLVRKLLDDGYTPVPISINFSRLHLNNTKILEKLKEMLTKYDLSPEYLEIEITESALSENDIYMMSIFYEIKRLGFKLSMDDFGSGLSSLNLLRKLPFDILKLDKDFFQSDRITDREKVVISNIVRLTKELDMDIIAEGVETDEQVSFLRDIQCPVVQGYIYSKPIPLDNFVENYYNA